MRRNRIRRRRLPARPTTDFARWHPTAIRYALTRGWLRPTVAGGPTLVTSSDDELDVARAAWRILTASGGLVDRGEIARRYGLTHKRVHRLTTQRNFPAPIGHIGLHPVWLAIEVDRYRAAPPPGGRPPAAKPDD